MGKFIEMSGKKFGKLDVVNLAYIKKFAFWNCICECGNSRIVRGTDLRNNNTKSCGCINPTWYPDEISKFYTNVPKYIENECWIWHGRLDHKGYGRFVFKDIAKLAHRASYELFKGPIPKGLLICHRCDNPPCVNPHHLYAGTYSDNAKDRYKNNKKEK